MTAPLKPKTFSNKLDSLMGISKKTVEEHLKLYLGYVNKYNEIDQRLADLNDEDYAQANQTYSKIRELKVELSFAWGGVINHEIYFGHLGGNKGTTSSGIPDGTPFIKQIEKNFGSFDIYVKDLKASGISARGWVWTAWNHREKKLRNYIGDSQNTFSVWYATPLVALDTYEHAYFLDYGTARGKYIDAFLDNMNWSIVSKQFDLLRKKV